MKISGADPDFHRRDLWNAINDGQFPEWELGVQLFDEDFANKFDFDVLDATKLIPEEVLPLTIVGRMVLDANVDNFFAETEQVAFCTRDVVPGIDFTNDPLLQGRNLSYVDTQLSRLGGPNYTQLPVNAPRCPVINMQRDGHMQMRAQTGRVSNSPSSLEASSPRQDPHQGFTSSPSDEQGGKLRIRSESFADHFSQALMFFNSQTETEQNHIISAIFELSKVDSKIVRTRMVGQLANVDATIAQRVASGLGMSGPIKPVPTTVAARKDLAPSAALSILAKAKPGLATKVIGCLIADGSDDAEVAALREAATAQGAMLKIVAPKIGGARTRGNKVFHTYVIFAKAAPFTQGEIDRCKEAQKESGRSHIILLSDRELEPYFVYERAAKDFEIDSTAISLSDLARTTYQLYFHPTPRRTNP